MSVIGTEAYRAVVEQISPLAPRDLDANWRGLPPCDRPARISWVKMLCGFLEDDGGPEAVEGFEREIGKPVCDLTRAEIECVLYLYFDEAA